MSVFVAGGALLIVLALAAASWAKSANAPYTTERVAWANGDVKLEGTLYLPKSEGKVPGAILLAGSGTMGRVNNAGNRVLFNHAERLAGMGVAVLFYDKRGVGQSTGDFRTAGFDVLAADAIGGLEILRAHPRVDGSRLGTIGVSQGAWIAAQMVERGAPLSFHVFISGGAPVTPAEQDWFVQSHAARAAGVPDADLGAIRQALDLAFEVYRAGDSGDWAALDAARQRLSERPWWKDSPVPLARRDEGWWRWYRSFMDYDPRSTIRSWKTPVFAAYGDADRLFDVEVMQREWQAIAAAGVPVTVRLYPGVGHALRRGRDTDQPAEYWADLSTWLAAAAGIRPESR
jgi:dipeptidyl aminopeptidase/acylaminoacyl peptidase